MVREIIAEMYAQRSLLAALVRKELQGRYSRPWLGWAWALVAPLAQTVILYVVFALFLKFRIVGMPFVLYLSSAVFVWGYFQASVLGAATSLVDNRNLLREARLPHYFLPLAVCLANGAHFLPGLGGVLILSWIMMGELPLALWALPLVILLLLGLTVAVGVVLSLLYVRVRDIKYLAEILLQVLFYSTPVFYSLSLVRESFPSFLWVLYGCNPFVGLVSLFRGTLIAGALPDALRELGAWMLILPAPLACGCALWVSALLYRRFKTRINDYLSY